MLKEALLPQRPGSSNRCSAVPLHENQKMELTWVSRFKRAVAGIPGTAPKFNTRINTVVVP